ncbi:MAG: T9SS type A sorting domain-containing protein [Saprospiraceae bacterium]|nr:T9SS type A sorting domain-containing protein [Saprospiraceae bacterium]
MKIRLLLISYFLGLFILNAQTHHPASSIQKRLERIARTNNNAKPLHERSTYGVLDSIYGGIFFGDEWKDYSRQHFGYENNLYIVDSTFVNFNLTQQLPTLWQDTDKTNFTYDSEGRLMKMIRSFFSLSAGQFEELLLNEYYYDSENRLIQEDISIFEAGAWPPPSGKFIYIYDALGNNTNVITYGFDTDLNEWVLEENDTNTYYPDGKLKTEVVRFPENNVLVDDQRYSYTYNSDGLLSEVFVEYWDVDESAWFNSEKDFYYYEAGEMQPIQVLIQVYDENEWIDAFRYDYFYSEPSSVRTEPTKNTLECTISNPYIPGSLISCEIGASEEMTLSLTDLLGRVVQMQSLSIPLEVGKVSAGYYLLKISDKHTGERRYQKKLFVAGY